MIENYTTWVISASNLKNLFPQTSLVVIAQLPLSIYLYRKAYLSKAMTMVCSYWLLPSTQEVPDSIPGPYGRTMGAFFLHLPFLPSVGDSFFPHTFPVATPGRLGLLCTFNNTLLCLSSLDKKFQTLPPWVYYFALQKEEKMDTEDETPKKGSSTKPKEEENSSEEKDSVKATKEKKDSPKRKKDKTPDKEKKEKKSNKEKKEKKDKKKGMWN